MKKDLKVIEQAVKKFSEIIKNNKVNNKWKISYAERNSKIAEFRKTYLS